MIGILRARATLLTAVREAAAEPSGYAPAGGGGGEGKAGEVNPADPVHETEFIYLLIV